MSARRRRKRERMFVFQALQLEETGTFRPAPGSESTR
jgi:hypothetical protein